MENSSGPADGNNVLYFFGGQYLYLDDSLTLLLRFIDGMQFRSLAQQVYGAWQSGRVYTRIQITYERQDKAFEAYNGTFTDSDFFRFFEAFCKKFPEIELFGLYSDEVGESTQPYTYLFATCCRAFFETRSVPDRKVEFEFHCRLWSLFYNIFGGYQRDGDDYVRDYLPISFRLVRRFSLPYSLLRNSKVTRSLQRLLSQNDYALYSFNCIDDGHVPSDQDDATDNDLASVFGALCIADSLSLITKSISARQLSVCCDALRQNIRCFLRKLQVKSSLIADDDLFKSIMFLLETRSGLRNVSIDLNLTLSYEKNVNRLVQYFLERKNILTDLYLPIVTEHFDRLVPLFNDLDVCERFTFLAGFRFDSLRAGIREFSYVDATIAPELLCAVLDSIQVHEFDKLTVRVHLLESRTESIMGAVTRFVEHSKAKWINIQLTQDPEKTGFKCENMLLWQTLGRAISSNAYLRYINFPMTYDSMESVTCVKACLYRINHGIHLRRVNFGLYPNDFRYALHFDRLFRPDQLVSALCQHHCIAHLTDRRRLDARLSQVNPTRRRAPDIGPALGTTVGYIAEWGEPMIGLDNGYFEKITFG